MRKFVPVLFLLAFLGAGAFLASCKSSNKSNPMSPATPADVTITITGINGSSSFSPNPATVKMGQTVAWKNNGGTDHTATADGGAFDTHDIPNTATSSAITMSATGSFGYHCSIHPSMVGALNVTP